MLVGGYLPCKNVTVWINLLEEYIKWKGVDLRSFVNVGLPRAITYRVCQCIETRKPKKKKRQNADDKQ